MESGWEILPKAPGDDAVRFLTSSLNLTPGIQLLTQQLNLDVSLQSLGVPAMAKWVEDPTAAALVAAEARG